MIRLTRINHVPLVLNADLIEHIEITPDTVIAMTSGQKFMVLESADVVIERVIEFRRAILERDQPEVVHTYLAGRGRSGVNASMADKIEQPKSEGGKAKTGPAKKAGSRPDLASIGGIILAVGGIVGGLIMEGGKIKDISQVTAAIIVLGGTLGAVMVSTPLSVLKGAALRFIHVLLTKRSHPMQPSKN